MKMYIYGAWETGMIALQRIKERYGEDIEGFLDTKKTGFFSKYKIFKPSEISNDAVIIFAHDNIIVAAEMYDVIKGNGFKNLYWFMNLSDEISNKQGFLVDECFFIRNWGDCLLPNMEMHISDMCNLNCKNCTHFSPLYKEIGVNYDKCIEDIKILKSKFSNIGRLDILGGEPLLNPELDKYIVGLRKVLPDTYLNIFTNGLLIPKLSESVLTIIRENNVTVTISEYPPVRRMIDRIISHLKKASVRYRITSFRGDFNIPITTSLNTKHPYKCISDGCVCVSNGKISRCPTLMYIHKFNEEFGTSLPEEGLISLENCPDGKELMELLKKNIPLCNYCIECGTEWSVCGNEKHLEDFAVRD